MDQPQYLPSSSSKAFPKVIAFTILNTKAVQIHHETNEIPSSESTPVSSSTTAESSPKLYCRSMKECLLNESTQFGRSELNEESLNFSHSSTSSSSSTSDDGEYSQYHHHKHCKKVCFSCGTKKTPRWHKSRFLCNLPKEFLCNACAIRIKKYHYVCSHCHYALNKEQQLKGICPRCNRKFANLIHEDGVDLSLYNNQLDSILAAISV